MYEAPGGNPWNCLGTCDLPQENDTRWEDTEADVKNTSEMLFLETVKDRAENQRKPHVRRVTSYWTRNLKILPEMCLIQNVSHFSHPV